MLCTVYVKASTNMKQTSVIFFERRESMFVHISNNYLFWCFERDRGIESNEEYMYVC